VDEMQGFLDLLIIIPPLFYTHLAQPPEVCESPEQAAHYCMRFISVPALASSQSSPFSIVLHCIKKYEVLNSSVMITVFWNAILFRW
jgi:hypothetical protein